MPRPKFISINADGATRLNDDGKVLYDAYTTFSKNGISHGEATKIEKLDDALKDADIQLTYSEDGKFISGATIIDSRGKSVKVR